MDLANVFLLVVCKKHYLWRWSYGDSVVRHDPDLMQVLRTKMQTSQEKESK